MSLAKCKIKKLQEEKIYDQKEVIDLQKELISKKNEQLSLVNKTVEKEVKSFSSFLQQSCSTALSPKNIATAVKNISKEEDRTKEIEVFGVAEEHSESPSSKVTEILKQMDKKPRIAGCKRIGQRITGKSRPIIFNVTVKSTDIVYKILRRAKRLKDIDGFKTVYIAPNRTPEERVSRQKLVTELKKIRSENLDCRYFIRKDGIVKAET